MRCRFLLKISKRLPTSPDKAEILKKTSEMVSTVAGEGASSSILQMKLRNSLV